MAYSYWGNEGKESPGTKKIESREHIGSTNEVVRAECAELFFGDGLSQDHLL